MLNHRVNNKRMLEHQMTEQQGLKEEARKQYLKERGQIDDIIQNIIKED